MVATTMITTIVQVGDLASKKESSMPSLEMKPNSGGSAAIDAAAMTAAPNVKGSLRQMGPKRCMSRVPVW